MYYLIVIIIFYSQSDSVILFVFKLDDDSRRLCRDLKDQAMAIETQLKEKKKSQIMEKVKTILDKCVSFDQLNISKLEPSKYRLVHIPLLKSKIGNTSLCETEDKPASPKKLSLPNSPVCDYSTEELHKEFAAMISQSYR